MSIIISLFLEIFSGFASLSFAQNESGASFSIIALPDTQGYVNYAARGLAYPEIFIAQTRWIRDHKDELNIVGVVHEGDITTIYTGDPKAKTDRERELEMGAADVAMSILHGEVPVLPYFMCIGNHDMDEVSERSSQWFNRYFGAWRFEGRPWYGGNYKNENENAYYYFDAGAMKFMVICLEYGPRDEVLDWANKVTSQHQNRMTIVATHSYMNHDDTRVKDGDRWSPDGDGVNNGEAMWDKFVRRHENIFLVLSGHILGDGLGRLTSIGDNGNPVHQILANYQMKPHGGDGWLRIMTFVPAANKISVRTYSPTLDQYATDEQNQFTLEWEMQSKVARFNAQALQPAAIEPEEDIGLETRTQIAVGAGVLPLVIDNQPIGSREAVSLKVGKLPEGTKASLFLTMTDVDQPSEVRIYINEHGPLAPPEKIISNDQPRSASLEIPVTMLKAGSNKLEFVFADNLQGRTSGFCVNEVKLLLSH